MGARRLAAGVAVLLALAGCSTLTGTDSGADTAGSEASSDPESTDQASDETTQPPATPVATGTAAEADDVSIPFPDPGGTATADPSGGALLTVTTVRVGAHGAYDRVVFDLAGEGTPGWIVEHVEVARDDPSDKEVTLAGDGIVQVILTGTGYPMDTGFDEWTGGPITTEGYAQLWEVAFQGTFEGQTLAFLGTKDEDAAFRVFTLADPLRLVVDVRH